MARAPEMMPATRAAQFLGVARKTLNRWNRAGVGPPRVRKLKRYWYTKEQLKEWLRDGAVRLASEQGLRQLASEQVLRQFGKPPRLPNAGAGRLHQ